ncbi:MAG: DoxX family protein [Proteobacteria bacterium SG_bin9]|nr:MAG: DoxX family protein [Proteobacteria bacterium SG_bin9]
MPAVIACLLDSSWFALFARVVLTFPFWGSAFGKLFNFNQALAEMAMFGLNPAWAFAIATIVTQLGGALLVISNRGVWLGAGALGIFTALTIPIAHRFWEMSGQIAMLEFFLVTEHVAMIGGLMIVAILSRQTPRQGA